MYILLHNICIVNFKNCAILKHANLGTSIRQKRYAVLHTHTVAQGDDTQVYGETYTCGLRLTSWF